MYFAMGVVYMAWGFWGQLMDACPDPSIHDRFEAAMFWGALSLWLYSLDRPKKKPKPTP
jgi:hypothetical protein